MQTNVIVIYNLMYLALTAYKAFSTEPGGTNQLCLQGAYGRRGACKKRKDHPKQCGPGAGGPGEVVRDGGAEGTRGMERSAQGWHSLNYILKGKEASGKRTVQKRGIL